MGSFLALGRDVRRRSTCRSSSIGITLPGSLFLAIISVLPAIAGAVWNIQIAFSGVSILIVVGVALETMKQIESQLTMRNYEGILT